MAVLVVHISMCCLSHPTIRFKQQTAKKKHQALMPDLLLLLCSLCKILSIDKKSKYLSIATPVIHLCIFFIHYSFIYLFTY